MRMLRQVLAIPLSLLTITTSSAFADERHLVDPSQLAAAVARHVAAGDTDRAAVREALARSEVQGVAASMGIDLKRLAAAVDTMSDDELRRAASAAQQVNNELVGGASTVSISTTTLIIILLVLILLVVALR
jgi:hypothetical protein